MVVHKGGAHGGHYTAYIRDTDSLGTWSSPEEGAISVLSTQGPGQLDVIECDSPIELVQTILNDAPRKTLSVDKLGGVRNTVVHIQLFRGLEPLTINAKIENSVKEDGHVWRMISLFKTEYLHDWKVKSLKSILILPVFTIISE